jgi:hypothetical protein
VNGRTAENARSRKESRKSVNIAKNGSKKKLYAPSETSHCTDNLGMPKLQNMLKLAKQELPTVGGPPKGGRVHTIIMVGSLSQIALRREFIQSLEQFKRKQF